MKRLLPFFLFILISSAISGQTEKILNPADLKQQTIITEPLSLRKGYFRAGLTYEYSVFDKYFYNSGVKDYAPESSWITSTKTTILGQYGITDRIMVEIGIPYASNLTNIHRRAYAPVFDTMALFNTSVRGKGLSDLTISATYQIIPSGENRFSMKSTLYLTLPTAEKNPTNVKSLTDYVQPTGYGAFVVSPGITARLVSYPFSYTGYISYTYNFKGSKIMSPGDTDETDFRYGNYVIAGAGISLHLNEWIAITSDISYYYKGKGEIDNVDASDLNSSWALMYETRLVFQIKRFRLGEAVSIPLKGRNIAADPAYILLAQYVF